MKYPVVGKLIYDEKDFWSPPPKPAKKGSAAAALAASLDADEKKAKLAANSNATPADGSASPSATDKVEPLVDAPGPTRMETSAVVAVADVVAAPGSSASSSPPSDSDSDLRTR